MNYKIKIIDCEGTFELSYNLFNDAIKALKGIKLIGNGEALLLDNKNTTLYKKQFHKIYVM